VPTLPTSGEEDLVMQAHEAGAPIARGVLSASLVVIPHCGGVPMVEQSQHFDTAMRSFLGHR
jgi:pimeloyl-ACP methyl ester carboxylesterase